VDRSLSWYARLAFYWIFCAPVAFLAVAYTGSAPLLFLGSARESPWLKLALGPYVGLLFGAAAYLTWVGWRATRGDSPAAAMRPLPLLVWLGFLAFGVISGIVEFLRAS